jgi:hypothetical protein
MFAPKNCSFSLKRSKNCEYSAQDWKLANGCENMCLQKQLLPAVISSPGIFETREDFVIA